MVKNSPVNQRDIGDVGSIPGLGRSSGVGNGNPLQYCCLGNPMHGGAWWTTVLWSQRIRHDLATEYAHKRFYMQKANHIILGIRIFQALVFLLPHRIYYHIMYHLTLNHHSNCLSFRKHRGKNSYSTVSPSARGCNPL